MSDFIFDPTPAEPENAADLPRAIYFVLEAHKDRVLTPLEDAEEYAIHFGLPDRPDRLYAWTFFGLESALKGLEALAQMYPQAALWLRTELIETEMLGDTVWEGIVNAQAEIDPWDEDSEWVRVSRLIARADTYQEPLRRLLMEWIQGLDGPPVATWDILNHL